MTAGERRASLDPRLTAARPDLAAASLRGKVEAERFVEGERFVVRTERVDMRRRPRPDAPLDTQLLYGETLVVFEDEDGWGWAQADRDGYVGYVAMSALGRAVAPATHRVIVNRTFVYPAPDMKQPPFAAIPMDGQVAVEGRSGSFVKVSGHGFVYMRHVAPLSEVTQDYVSVALELLGVPYLWGGKSAYGIDCSGLVQLACSMAGFMMPRDTDMQEKLGTALVMNEGLVDLQRGDLVYWKGHVGIMCDASMLLHANAHHMLVACEPLHAAQARIMATGSAISSIRRPSHHMQIIGSDDPSALDEKFAAKLPPGLV